MARRRMIGLDIYDDDRFVDMPPTAQNLYTHLLVRADDDGFIKPKNTIRVIRAGEQDLGVLKANGFVTEFDSGVIVLNDWLAMNSIRKDRYTPTRFVEEQKQISVAPDKTYVLNNSEMLDVTPLSERRELLATSGQPSGNQLVPQGRVGKGSLGKDSLDKSRLDKLSGGEYPPAAELKNDILGILNRNQLSLSDNGVDQLRQRLNQFIVYTGEDTLAMFDSCLQYAVINRKDNPIKYALVRLRKNIDDGYTTLSALETKESSLHATVQQEDLPDIPTGVDIQNTDWTKYE